MEDTFEHRKSVGLRKATMAMYFFKRRNLPEERSNRRENTELLRSYVKDARALGWRGRVVEPKPVRPLDRSGDPGKENSQAVCCKIIPFVCREERERELNKLRILRAIIEHANQLNW